MELALEVLLSTIISSIVRRSFITLGFSFKKVASSRVLSLTVRFVQISFLFNNLCFFHFPFLLVLLTLRLLLWFLKEEFINFLVTSSSFSFSIASRAFLALMKMSLDTSIIVFTAAFFTLTTLLLFFLFLCCLLLGCLRSLSWELLQNPS